MKYALLLFIFIYAKGCNDQKSEADLDGAWKISSIENQKMTNTEATNCTINLDNNSLNISVGCNNHSANFKVVEEKLEISNVIATEKFCSDLAEIEKMLNNNLPTISDFKLENDILSLINNKGDVAITLVR